MSKPAALASVPPPVDAGGKGAASLARRQAESAMDAAVPLAAAVVLEALRTKDVPRNAQHRYQMARWVLDVVMERAPESESQTGAQEPQRKLTPQQAMDELRKRLEQTK